ncbi:unnamed protein product, partial [Allacma fusca]
EESSAGGAKQCILVEVLGLEEVVNPRLTEARWVKIFF